MRFDVIKDSETCWRWNLVDGSEIVTTSALTYSTQAELLRAVELFKLNLSTATGPDEE